jgi:predicted DNA-binding protein
MNDVSLNIRMDRELHDDFIKAATEVHRPAAQIVRDFIRQFVQQEQGAAKSAVSVRVSEEEQQRRNAAINQANAIVSLEGFPESPEFNALSTRYARGEITLDEFLAADFPLKNV